MRSGRRVTTITARWDMDEDHLAGALLAAVGTELVFAGDPPAVCYPLYTIAGRGTPRFVTSLSRAHTERIIRQLMSRNAASRFYWRDDFAGRDYSGEPGEAECHAWALEQVTRL